MDAVITLILCLLGTYFGGTLVGYIVHRALHQKWCGKYNKAHMTHHLVKYPTTDMLSKEYRQAGKDDTFMIFVPWVLAFGLTLIFVFPIWIWAICMVVMAIGGYAHEYFHTHFHLEGSWMIKYKFFLRLRELHAIHHGNMQTNMGIYEYIYDHIFRTYRKDF